MAKPPEEAKKAESALEKAPNDPVAAEIAKRIGSLVPGQQKAQIVAQIVSLVKSESFSGPIAHPKHLREYEEICPGSADRIIHMAEESLEHERTVQSRALDADIRDMREGRWLGFAALCLLIVCAIVCGIMGNNILALAFLGAGALGAVGAVIKGRGSQDKT